MKDICTKIVDGDHNPPKGQTIPTKYIMISSKNINNHSLCSLDEVRYLSAEQFCEADGRTKATPGDIFMTSVASLGRTVIYDGSLNISFQRSVTVISTLVSNRYLQLFIDSPLYQKYIDTNAKGTAQRGFYLNQVEDSWVPIPPYAEQEKIYDSAYPLLNIVDEIEGLGDKLKGDIDKVKGKVLALAISGKLVSQAPSDEPAIELLKRINPDFKPCDNSHYGNLPDGWTICRMGDVIRLISGTSYDKSDVQESGIKILRGGNVQDGEILERDDDVYVQMSREIAECNVRVGDIVIVASTGSADLIGKAGYIRKEYKYTQIGAFLRIARPIILELSPYLNLIFSSEIYRSHIRVKAKGTNINNIKAAYINDFVIPLPPIDEQVRIVAAVKTYFGIIWEIKAAL